MNLLDAVNIRNPPRRRQHPQITGNVPEIRKTASTFQSGKSGYNPRTRSSPPFHVVAMPKRPTVHRLELSLVTVGIPTSLPLEFEVAWWWSTFVRTQPTCIIRPPHRSPTINITPRRSRHP
nr:hypothetical protein Iba_chr02fCG9870 [Ipomoea batatas]